MIKRKRNYFDEDDDSNEFYNFFGNENCSIKLNKVVVKDYHVYLTKEIKSSDHYVDFLKLLETSDEDDKIKIHINSPGGHVDTAIQIITAMKQSKAEITTEISAVAHSAASLIFLAGTKYKIHNFSCMMCHYYTGCIIGKGNEINEQVKFDEKFYQSFFKTVYKDFMTIKEIDELIKGKDFWFDAYEIRKRLSNEKKGKK